MNISVILKNYLYLSLYKSIKFNLHYFGLKKGLKFPVLVSKNYSLHTLKGRVYMNNFTFKQVLLGFGDVGIFDRKYDRGIWQNSGDIYFNGRCSLGHGSKISNSGTLILGKNFINTAKCQIICKKKVSFGDNVLVSWDSLIMDSDFHALLGGGGRNCE